MIHIYTAVIPIFSLILIGYLLKKIKFPSYEFWPLADKLTYYILMPSLLVYKLSTSSLDSFNNLYFVSTGLIAISILFCMLVLVNYYFKFKPDAFTSIVQGGVRYNTYILLALVDSLYGDTGLALAAILMMFAIPLINVICVSTFAFYIDENKFNILNLFSSIAKNPLIIACVLGGGLNFLNIKLHISIENTISIISSAALPLGLLSVGFGLIMKDVSSSIKEILVSSIAKLIIMPLIILTIASYFKLSSQMISILVIFAVLPTAPSAFVLARQLKGDVTLMASLITIQTLVSSLIILLVLNNFI